MFILSDNQKKKMYDWTVSLAQPNINYDMAQMLEKNGRFQYTFRPNSKFVSVFVTDTATNSICDLTEYPDWY